MVGACLLFLCAQISVPLEPVPVTLQTVAVLIIGLTFNKAEALKSIWLYLAMGALGLPVFANFMGGFSILVGPRGGFLFGFMASIWVMCSLRERLTNVDTQKLLLIGLVGSAVVYTLGVPWLSMFIGWKAAVAAGFMPFILPGLVKSVIVAAAIGYLKK
jgi:biotin transport system substrate-specific component